MLCVHTYTNTYTEHRGRMVTTNKFLEVLSSILDSKANSFEAFIVFFNSLDKFVLN
jgi:hypothetical protein